MEKWNLLVDFVKQKWTFDEATIQKLWEQMFAEIFGYSRLMGEVENHRSLTIGSGQRVVPDIIIKNGGKDLFIVELKRHCIPFDEQYREQLFSYMKLLNLNIGLLIGDKIYIYILSGGTVKASCEIPFAKDNENGKKFVKLFSKGNFSEEKVFAFVNAQTTKENNVAKLRKELQTLSIEKLIKEHYSAEYSSEEIEEAISCFEFHASLKRPIAQPIIKSSNSMYPQQPKIKVQISGMQTFIIKKGISPQAVKGIRELKVYAGMEYVMVYDVNDRCVGVVFEHSEPGKPAHGQAEIRFFDQYKNEYKTWHRMFVDGRRNDRIFYIELEREIARKGLFEYHRM